MDVHRQPPIEEIPTHFKERLLVGPQAREAFAELLNQSFEVPDGASFLDDFPVWDEHNAPVSQQVLRSGLFDDTRLVACAGLRLTEMKGASGVTKIALLGAVATHWDFRGRGLATQVANAAVRRAQQAGAAAIFLWGSEHDLYQRLGFELCGSQAMIPLKELALPASSDTQVLTGWRSGIMKRLQSRADGLVIHPSDERWIKQHRNVKWYWCGNPDDPTAYAAYGRGIDLQGLVHEWGGEQAELKSLLAQIRRDHPEAVLLGSPVAMSERGWVPPLESLQFLCMAKVLDPTRLYEAAYGKDPMFQAERTADGWALKLEATGALQLGPSELSQFFFGQAARGVEPWNKRFPLPLWFWGLDGA